MTLIIDENLPPSWRDFLGSFGVTAIHWKDIGSIGDPDEVILDHSREHEAILLTQDLDFTRILARRGSALPSIIQLRVQCPIPEVIGDEVVAILTDHVEQLRAGCLISLDARRHRIRLLPLT